MSRYLNGVSFKELTGEKITAEKCGSDMIPKCGSYGAHTLFTESHREFVIWNSMGEVNLSEVLTKPMIY